jgi:diketogulonate reductase-like aldo/keto reductase
MRFQSLPGGGQIPVVGLGTWKVGGGSSPDYSQDDKALRGLRAALEMGYTHIDTAEMYAGGHTEELVGQAIQGYQRSDLFLTSKVWPSNLAYQAVLNACEASLERLQTDYLDLYLVHWPSDDIPLEETFGALSELVRRGLVRHIGVSNFNLRQLRQARNLSETPLTTNQVPYSFYNRRYVQNGVLADCLEAGMIVTAYTPLEKGRVADDLYLAAIAEKVGASPVQVALAWLVNQPGVVAIPMSLNPRHLKQNLRAADLVLAPEDMEQLNQHENGMV